MSCHSIGNAANHVIYEIVQMMDRGEITRDVAKKLVRFNAKAINYCDGNENEATDCIRECLCGNCMRMIPKGYGLYSYWRLDSYAEQGEVERRYSPACDALCEQCFDRILGDIRRDPAAGPAERKRIREAYGEDSCKSVGEYWEPY